MQLDPDRITQAMLQLAANAATYGDPGRGRIELGSARDDRRGSSRAVLGAGFFGPGIRLEDQERIFQRFQRGSSARGRGQGGSGLGLAIVASIAAAHGGRVTVDSRPGHGATFTIVLPPRVQTNPASPHRKAAA